jgi:peptidoglycan/LPS O-acetylase OafA/YrhL
MTLTAAGLSATSHLRPMSPNPQAGEAPSAHVVAANVVAMSVGRIGATAAATAGLIGILLGGRALARAAGRSRRSAPRTGMMLGLIAVALGGLVIATSNGGLGTGNGLGGAAVAIMAGLIAIALGFLARARGREVA